MKLDKLRLYIGLQAVGCFSFLAGVLLLSAVYYLFTSVSSADELVVDFAGCCLLVLGLVLFLTFGSLADKIRRQRGDMD